MKMGKGWNLFAVIVVAFLAFLIFGRVFRFLGAVVLKIGGIAVVIALAVLAWRIIRKKFL